MDTVLTQRQPFEKTATSAAGIGIAICLILSQNLIISAKDIGNITGISPGLNYIKERQRQEEIFEQEISQKYSNAEIVEVEKGVKHVRMIKYYNNRPVRINIVELSQGLNKNLSVEPSIASETLAARQKISNIATRENAIVAINGGYFKPQTGVPLGTLMINKKVYTGPIYDRVAMGIFDNNKYEMARVQLKANVETNIGGLKIDNVNQPRMLSVHTIVYTPDWGEYSPPTPRYGKQIVIEDGRLVKSSYGRCKIPQNGFVIVGAEKNLNKIINAKRFRLNIKINPEWKDVNHIISGGPYLIKNGDEYKCNLILCDSERKWLEYIPEATEEIKALFRQYAAEVEKAELIGQPEHMHELIRCQSKSAAGALHTRVMKVLLDMGVLKLPTEEQAKGLCTIMFMGE